MVQQMQPNVAHQVHDDPCPRCGSADVRAIVYGPLDFEVEVVAGEVSPLGGLDDAPIFDCRECGFEWGFAVRDLLG
ncbi:hypothetical protein ACGGZK_06400 [Agromyces sp. MMS24-K17]|uniref:hypothetical protein n=1 Tax=Agromyces sp. MMS24-K17 TaxID=3372850 RepID=UPI0037550A8D